MWVRKKASVCCLDSFIGLLFVSSSFDSHYALSWFFSLIHVDIVLLIARNMAHSRIKLEKYRERAGSATVMPDCAVLFESCIMCFFWNRKFCNESLKMCSFLRTTLCVCLPLSPLLFPRVCILSE